MNRQQLDIHDLVKPQLLPHTLKTYLQNSTKRDELKRRRQIIHTILNSEEIPITLQEDLISKPIEFKRFLVLLHKETSANPNLISQPHYTVLPSLLKDFFKRHITFTTDTQTLQVITLLFKQFPNHFDDIKHMIYHTSLMQDYCLHLNSRFSNFEKYTTYKEQLAAQIKLGDTITLAAEENKFTFNLAYSEKGRPTDSRFISFKSFSIETLLSHLNHSPASLDLPKQEQTVQENGLGINILFTIDIKHL